MYYEKFVDSALPEQAWSDAGYFAWYPEGELNSRREIFRSNMKDRATIVCYRRGRLLLVTRERSRWSFPGGTVKHGEAPDDAAVRELAEETGLKASHLEFLFLFGGLRKRHHVFFANIPKGAVPQPMNEIARCHRFGVKRLGVLSTSVPTRKIAELIFGATQLPSTARED